MDAFNRLPVVLLLSQMIPSMAVSCYLHHEGQPVPPAWLNEAVVQAKAVCQPPWRIHVTAGLLGSVQVCPQEGEGEEAGRKAIIIIAGVQAVLTVSLFTARSINR